MKNLIFMKKENRDAYYRELKTRFPHLKFRRSSGGPSLLHPMYVADWEKETGRKLSDSDKGFGNTIYKTYFGKLYFVEKREDTNESSNVLR